METAMTKIIFIALWCGLLLPSHQIMSNFLGSHGLKHTRPLCLSPSPRVCPSSCPMNLWCHPAISSSVTLFSFCLHSFPASGAFPMSQLFASGGQMLELHFQNQSFWLPNEYSGLIFFRTNCGVDSKANLLGACTVLWNIEFLDLQYTCIVFRHKNDDIYFFNKLFFTLANKDVCIGRLAACHKSLTRTTKSGGVTLQSEWR